ncbi:MAG TPA: M14 family zinc carboxypeptidase [Acidimicrobiia bacterium]|nr:M14 family zinc carboxypeptidase [Acidimicrobiia bacterium]
MTFLNVDEIESALIGLNNSYPTLTELLPLPNVTYEGRRSHALAIGKPGYKCRPALVFVSGVHAREWGGPDILINLAADLLEKYTTNSGLAYGRKTFTVEEIRGIVELTTVVVFPDINPDGRAWSMGGAAGSIQAMFRKNRNPAGGGGANAGVDVNRNYDFLWDFPVKFHPDAVNAGTLASDNPSSPLFHGTGPFSEAEARNVLWLVDRFRNARYFVDVHSYWGDILHPWGDDENQSSDPGKNFANAAWDGARGLAGDSYGEYMPATRLAQHLAAATVMRDGIQAVRGEPYLIKQGFWLWSSTYPTSGTSEDWAFTREFINPRRGQLNAFVIEFNRNHDFFPTWAEMVDLIADIDAGLLALCSYARPGWWQRILCWFKSILDLIRGFWRRLFPWEIWGPYGPWAKIVDRLRGLVRQLTDRLPGRGG